MCVWRCNWVTEQKRQRISFHSFFQNAFSSAMQYCLITSRTKTKWKCAICEIRNCWKTFDCTKRIRMIVTTISKAWKWAIFTQKETAKNCSIFDLIPYKKHTHTRREKIDVNKLILCCWMSFAFMRFSLHEIVRMLPFLLRFEITHKKRHSF